MTVTREDVKRIWNEVMTDDPSLTSAQIVQGVRTRVQTKLQAETAPPYALPPPDEDKTPLAYLAKLGKADPREQARLHKESKDHKAMRETVMRASVSVEDHEAFEAWRASPEGQKHLAAVSGPGAPIVSDPHHFAQCQHNLKLWAQTDALVAEAGVK